MNINRIEVWYTTTDTRALVTRKSLESLRLKNSIKSIKLADVYTIQKDLSSKQLHNIADSLTNPVFQTSTVNTSLKNGSFDWALEIGFLPGVTDNVAATSKEIIQDQLKIKFTDSEGVYTSRLHLISGKLTQSDAEKIAASLANPLIQRIHIKSAAQFKKDRGMDPIAPVVKITAQAVVDTVDLNVTDEELIQIGKLGIKNKDGTRRGPLALDLVYLKTIQKYFRKQKRHPTDIELESIAQTWSEHCKHTIFADPIDDIKDGLFNTYIKKATAMIRKKKGKKDFTVSVFKDNSGAIVFDNKYLITHKVETHNSPSALDPFGGAITGIVGVNRDAIGFGLGARPVVNTYGYCFADPTVDTPLYKGANSTQKMLSSRRILDGVVSGVNSGGNCSGIPTPQGFMIFDDRYRGKPLVFVGTVGLIPAKILGRKSYVKQAQPGDYIVVVGGRVGQDGIHGATFSSVAMDSNSPATAVQIGDPITQKKLSDALTKEARDQNLYNSITDNGAGGLSCSVAEMAKESGGAIVQLDRVPLKYPGLVPWQTWISESQERMTLAVPPNKWARFQKLMHRRGVEATVIGKFTKTKRCIVKNHNKVIMDIGMDFLHDGLPQKPMHTQKPQMILKKPHVKLSGDLSRDLLHMLQRQNITSFEFISQQYDHEVQGTSVLKPLVGKGRVNSEVSVIKPVLTSHKGIILSQGLFPQYSDIDPYHMATSSIDTAIRNIVAAGGNPDNIALLDNFCWCSSTEPERLWQLKQAAKACFDCALAYNAPFVSGKDSMFNDFKGFDKNGRAIKISIPPTLLISSISVIDDVKNVVSLDFKNAGDQIFLLGDTYEELGGSEYLSFKGQLGDTVPRVNAKANINNYKIFHSLISKNLISSAIAVTRGGLAVALAKSAISAQLGAAVSLKSLGTTITRDDFALFSESAGRILFTISLQNRSQVEKLARKAKLHFLGSVTEKPQLTITGSNNKAIINVSLNKMTTSYKSTFRGY